MKLEKLLIVFFTAILFVPQTKAVEQCEYVRSIYCDGSEPCRATMYLVNGKLAVPDITLVGKIKLDITFEAPSGGSFDITRDQGVWMNEIRYQKYVTDQYAFDDITLLPRANIGAKYHWSYYNENDYLGRAATVTLQIEKKIYSCFFMLVIADF